MCEVRLFLLWVAIAVTKSLQCWLVPVPSGFRSFGGPQLPVPLAEPALAQSESLGRDDTHCGIRPNVYRRSSMSCSWNLASHLSSKSQSYFPLDVLISAQ